MDRRSFLKAGASAAVFPAVQSMEPPPARAATEKVLRLAMTLGDVPLTTGQPSQGAEGIRFIGLTVYDALFGWDLSQRDRAAKIVPGLAESYSVDPDTKTTWTFALRKGVKFHDGSDFNADAVVWNLDKLLKKDAPQFDQIQVAMAGSYIAGIKSYRKVDDYTVAITTVQPDAMFYYRIAGINFSSPARWQEVGGDWNKFAERPSGTGPWILEKLVPRSRAELVRNPNYWNRDRIPKLDRLILLAMPDANTRVAALLSGQIDWVEAPPPDTVPRLKQQGMQIVSNVYPHVWPYWLSYTPDSPFLDIRVRKAANLAIDREGLCQFLGGLAKPARGQVDVTHPWFGKPTFEIKYDPAAAKKLMAEAGYGPNKRCKVKFLTSQAGSGQMQPLPMNEFVQENLNQVGFDIEIEVADWEALRARRRARADGAENKGVYGLNNSWSIMDPDFGFMSVIYSKNAPPVGNNWSLYNDPTADALCDKAKLEFDVERQYQAIAELHQYVVDQAMWIWVVHDLNPRALAPKVKGFVPPQAWYVDLSTLDIA
jgi:peptide/nickel transport system substrate-binding protein